MAGRKVSYAVVAAVALVVAMLVVVAAAEEDCGVNKGQVMSACLSYCANGNKGHECCDALRNANMDCLCSNYWNRLQSSPYYARCAAKIQSNCAIKGCRRA